MNEASLSVRAESIPSYALILPPGFVLIPAQGDVEANVRAVVGRHYEGRLDDRNRGQVRRLQRSLVESVESARDRGVLDVVLPLGVPWRAPVSLSLAFAPARPDGGPVTASGSTTVTTRAGEARREIVDHEGVDPFTVEGTGPEDAGGGALRTVHHVWMPPREGIQALVGTFTISGSPDPELSPLVDQLTELGDTMMASVRWRSASPGSTGESVGAATASDTTKEPQ